MGIFDTLVSNLQQMGAFQFLFPFLLALAIFYGVLSYAMQDKIKKGPVGLISIVLAFFVMLFAATNPQIVPFLAILSGTTGMVATGILMIVVLLGLAGFKISDVFKEGYARWALVLVLIGIGILLFMGAGGSNIMPSVFISPDITTAIIVILIIGLAMYFMTHEGGEKPAAPAGGERQK
ncbi:MAG: hypothetical protein MUP55_01695 [Candidatus Aenigmarchaeota archaeon]|nr:hypothetical protein [Candidatus Aenigmarchaeota archaeon]